LMMPDCTHCPLHDLLTRNGVAERVEIHDDDNQTDERIVIWRRGNGVPDAVHIQIWGDTVEPVEGWGETILDAIGSVQLAIEERGGL